MPFLLTKEQVLWYDLHGFHIDIGICNPNLLMSQKVDIMRQTQRFLRLVSSSSFTRL